MESAGFAGHMLGKIFGNGKTVIRASYTYKNYTEGAQSFWNFGSNNGANFNTYYYANPVRLRPVRRWAGFTMPARRFSELRQGFLLRFNLAVAISIGDPGVFPGLQRHFVPHLDPHIKQPMLNLAVRHQRQLSPNNVLEVRYVGTSPKINGWRQLQRSQYF